MFSVKDKTIIVTGAKGGNGSAISDGLEEYGATVVRADLPRYNVRNPIQLDMLVAKALQYDNRIDGLVNCAGITRGNDLLLNT